MKQTKPILHARDHRPGGADPLVQYPTGDTIDQAILAAAPAGFWKLNESTGSIAHDSSGFGQDLSTTTPELDPLWGAPAGPPGEQAANFDNGTGGVGGTASRVSRSWPAITGSFTAGIWVNRTSTSQTPAMGQALPTSGGPGWWLLVTADNYGTAGQENRPATAMGGSSELLLAVNPLLNGTWAFLALVYDAAATVYKLYVNGLLEDTSAPFTFVPAAGGPTTPLWVGHPDASGGSVLIGNFVGSYAFLVNRAMSGTELLSINNADAAGTASTDGLVLGFDDQGNLTWVQPKVDVTVNGEPPPVANDPPVSLPDDPNTAFPGDDDWIVDQPFLWGGGSFEVPPNKWTTIPFTNQQMERWSNVTGAGTKMLELAWDDPLAGGWINPSEPRVITIPHDLPYYPAVGSNPLDWMQVCLRLEGPMVEPGSYRALRVFETTHQKAIVEQHIQRSEACDEHGAVDARREAGTPGTGNIHTGETEMFASGDTGGFDNGNHDTIYLVPNSGEAFYEPGRYWLPGHAQDPPNPTLKKGMRLVAQVWHDASVPLTFHCDRAPGEDATYGPYRPHFVIWWTMQRSWGSPWSDWPLYT